MFLISLKKLFELYIKASLHVALAVTAFAFVTALELDIPADPILLVFIFTSTVVSYNFTKYVHMVVAGLDENRALLTGVGIVTAIALVGMSMLLFYLPIDVILASAGLGAITIAYAIPISDSHKNLRNIYGLKIAVIALVWSAVTVGLPVLNYGYELIPQIIVGVEALQRGLFVAVLILPFDIRDYRSDDRTLGTLPQIIGVRESKKLGLGLLLSCLLLEAMINPVLSAPFVIFAIMAGITAMMVRRSLMIQSPYFASFWVEGIPIIWAVSLAIFTII